MKARSDVRRSSNVVRGFENASRASEVFRGLRRGFEDVRRVVGESGCDEYVHGSVMIVSAGRFAACPDIFVTSRHSYDSPNILEAPTKSSKHLRSPRRILEAPNYVQRSSHIGSPLRSLDSLIGPRFVPSVGPQACFPLF